MVGILTNLFIFVIPMLMTLIFVSCSPFLIKLIETYDFRDEMQKECFNEIFSFLNERVGNRILKGEFLFQK